MTVTAWGSEPGSRAACSSTDGFQCRLDAAPARLSPPEPAICLRHSQRCPAFTKGDIPPLGLGSPVARRVLRNQNSGVDVEAGGRNAERDMCECGRGCDLTEYTGTGTCVGRLPYEVPQNLGKVARVDPRPSRARAHRRPPSSRPVQPVSRARVTNACFLLLGGASAAFGRPPPSFGVIPIHKEQIHVCIYRLQLATSRSALRDVPHPRTCRSPSRRHRHPPPQRPIRRPRRSN